MAIIVKQVDDATVASISQRLDANTAVEVQKKLFLLLDEGKHNLILDLADVDYLSSAGMRTLLLVSKRAKELSASICLINVSPQLIEILEMTGFLPLIQVYKDLDSALDHQKSQRQANPS